MRIIALIAQKGGTGKTTLAINLAVTSLMHGLSSRIIDMDPQPSAHEWHGIRTHIDAQDWKRTCSRQPHDRNYTMQEPRVDWADLKTLPRLIEEARLDRIEYLFIDTAPAITVEALKAISFADLLLLVLRPSILDYRSSLGTTKSLAETNTPLEVIICQAESYGEIHNQMQELFEARGITVNPCRIGRRALFIHSLMAGLGVAELASHEKATAEMTELFRNLTEKAYA